MPIAQLYKLLLYCIENQIFTPGTSHGFTATVSMSDSKGELRDRRLRVYRQV